MFTEQVTTKKEKKLDCGHITTSNSRRKKIKKTPFEESVEISNTPKVDNKHINTSQNNILESSANRGCTENEHESTDLVKILANLTKGHIPPALSVSKQDLCSHGETSNTTDACEIDKESNPIKSNLSPITYLIDPDETSRFCFNAREIRSLASKKQLREIWQKY